MTLEAANAELIAAIPQGWQVARPTFDYARNEWHIYAFDTREPRPGKPRQDAWTIVAPTQEMVIRAMAYCLLRPWRDASK
jgi:hypothetical protein